MPKQKSLEAITYLALRDGPDRSRGPAGRAVAGGRQLGQDVPQHDLGGAQDARPDRDGADLVPEPIEGHYPLGDRVATDYGLFHELMARAEELDDPSGRADAARRSPHADPRRAVPWRRSWLRLGRAPRRAHRRPGRRRRRGARRDSASQRATGAAPNGPHGRACACSRARSGSTACSCAAAHAAGSIPGVHRAFQELAAAVADPDDGVEPEDTVHPETVALLEELTGQRPRVGRASA